MSWLLLTRSNGEAVFFLCVCVRVCVCVCEIRLLAAWKRTCTCSREAFPSTATSMQGM